VSFSPSSLEPPSARATLPELVPLVDAALEQYGIVATELESVRYYNNAIYRVVAADRQQYVLRVTSNHYSDSELRSEMQWLREMQTDPDVCVPEPVAARDGRLVIRAGAPSLAQARSCTLFRWMEGTHLPEDRMEAADFARVGMAAARLHRRSATFAPPPDFARPHWDEELSLDPQVRDTYERILVHLHLFFSATAVARFNDLAQRGRDRLREIRFDRLGYGLIHADFHAGNYLFHEDRVGFIDFEDLGWGAFLYDVATALFGAIERPDYAALEDAFTNSYTATLRLSDNVAEDLLIFQVLRTVFLTSLVVTRNDLAESAWWEGYVVGKLRRILGS
jgi:Ser/Thr protein kinase RdoA (MazF antagonist)